MHTVSFISDKNPHADLICFHSFCILLVESKEYNIKKNALQREAFKCLCYFKLTKLNEVRTPVI